MTGSAPAPNKRYHLLSNLVSNQGICGWPQRRYSIETKHHDFVYYSLPAARLVCSAACSSPDRACCCIGTEGYLRAPPDGFCWYGLINTCSVTGPIGANALEEGRPSWSSVTWPFVDLADDPGAFLVSRPSFRGLAAGLIEDIDVSEELHRCRPLNIEVRADDAEALRSCLPLSSGLAVAFNEDDQAPGDVRWFVPLAPEGSADLDPISMPRSCCFVSTGLVPVPGTGTALQEAVFCIALVCLSFD